MSTWTDEMRRSFMEITGRGLFGYGVLMQELASEWEQGPLKPETMTQLGELSEEFGPGLLVFAQMLRRSPDLLRGTGAPAGLDEVLLRMGAAWVLLGQVSAEGGPDAQVALLSLEEYEALGLRDG